MPVLTSFSIQNTTKIINLIEKLQFSTCIKHYVGLFDEHKNYTNFTNTTGIQNAITHISVQKCVKQI